MTGNSVYVAKGLREKKLHRALMQYDNPENKRYIVEALRKLNKMDLSKLFFGGRRKYGK